MLSQIYQGVLIVFASFGIIAAVWLALSGWLRPKGDIPVALLASPQNTKELEHAMDYAQWLCRRSGEELPLALLTRQTDSQTGESTGGQADDIKLLAYDEVEGYFWKNI